MAKRSRKTAKRSRKTRTTRPRRRPQKPAGDNLTALVNKLSISEMTARYNLLVPVANRLGLAWVRHHVSQFASRPVAIRALEKLVRALRAAGG
jgi:hypothetical protein